ncbi:DNA helicase [Tanacetum coccineum]
MRENIPTKILEATGIPNYHVNKPELQGYFLYELEVILNGFEKSVTDFGLEPPLHHLLKDLMNKLLIEEKNYKRELLMQDAAQSIPKLNRDQKMIYDLIVNASAANLQELLFVYNHSEIRKTFLWKTSISSLRSQGKIVLAMASSGATKEELISASIIESHLWWHFKICTLKENMRLLRYGLTNKERKRSKVFAKRFLDVGNGKVGEPDKEDNQDNSWITNSPEYCVSADETGMSELIDFIYDDATLKTPTTEVLQLKVIVCPKNDTANAVNAKILSTIEGQLRTYLSNYKAIPTDRETGETKMLYPMKYLNTIPFLVIKENIRDHYCIAESQTRKLHIRSKGAGQFIVEDILDFQPAVETQPAGTILAVSLLATINKSTNKDKGIPGTTLTASSPAPTNESTSKEKGIPETLP